MKIFKVANKGVEGWVNTTVLVQQGHDEVPKPKNSETKAS